MKYHTQLPHSLKKKIGSYIIYVFNQFVCVCARVCSCMCTQTLLHVKLGDLIFTCVCPFSVRGSSAETNFSKPPWWFFMWCFGITLNPLPLCIHSLDYLLSANSVPKAKRLKYHREDPSSWRLFSDPHAPLLYCSGDKSWGQCTFSAAGMWEVVEAWRDLMSARNNDRFSVGRQ